MTKNEINELSRKIIGCAIEVHRKLGPGLLEKIYEECMVMELEYNGLKVSRQQYIPIYYRGKELNCYMRLDLLVNDCIVVELKAVEYMIPLFKAQLLTYLKLMKKPKGLLINFNCDHIVSNLVSLVTDVYSNLEDG